MIEGKNIIIRTLQDKDLDEFLAFMNKTSDVGEFWPVDMFTDTTFRKTYNENGLWSDTGGKLVITDKKDKIVGNINVFRGIHYVDGFEIGYRIFRPKDRGKGYMTEAVKLFTPYMFLLKPINRLQICCVPGNIGSKIVAEKCGFTYEGTMRQATFVKGKLHDVDMFSMLRSEYEEIYNK